MEKIQKEQEKEEGKAEDSHKEKPQKGFEGKTDGITEIENSALSGGGLKKKRVVLLALLLVFLVAVMIAGGFYYRTAIYYRTHFFPNTNIDGVDCSNMEAETAIALLDAPIQNYTLKVVGRDYKTGESGNIVGEISSTDIQLNYGDTGKQVRELLNQQEIYTWLWAYLGKGNAFLLDRDIIFDEALLETKVKSWDACIRKNMVKAKDAYISETIGQDGYYEIISETQGTELDVDAVLQLAVEGIREQKEVIDLEEQGCYREASVKHNDKKLTETIDTANRWLSTSITYDWNGTEVTLDHDRLVEWITIENEKPVLDEEEVAAFVKAQAAEYDTYGKKKKFITTLGTEMTLSSRTYGWQTDTAAETEELVQLIYQGSVVKREPAYSKRAMQKGSNDIGNSYVEADLTNQHLYLYQDGNIVLETDFVSGTMISTYDCVTPEGIFGLTYKTRNAVLKGATYRTPVSYWMPFYGNYGMHDANWRGSFGGQIFITNGSHGCINLPPDMAGQIYEYVSEGFPVICYYYGGAPYIGIQADPAPETVPEEGTEWQDPEWQEPEWQEPEWQEPEWQEPVEEPVE